MCKYFLILNKKPISNKGNLFSLRARSGAREGESTDLGRFTTETASIATVATTATTVDNTTATATTTTRAANIEPTLVTQQRIRRKISNEVMTTPLRFGLTALLTMAIAAMVSADPMILLMNTQAKCMSVEAPADAILDIEYEAPGVLPSNYFDTLVKSSTCTIIRLT